MSFLRSKAFTSTASIIARNIVQRSTQIPFSPLPLQHKTAFHASASAAAPCIVETTSESAERLFRETKNLHALIKDQEQQLCEARSLLSSTVDNLRKAGITLAPEMNSKIQEHLKKHRSHRLEEHVLLKEKIAGKLNDVNLASRDVLTQETALNAHRSKLLQDAITLKKELATLEKIDVNSNEFLDREMDEKIAKKFGM